jgi:hypothetical protein
MSRRRMLCCSSGYENPHPCEVRKGAAPDLETASEQQKKGLLFQLTRGPCNSACFIRSRKFFAQFRPYYFRKSRKGQQILDFTTR